MSWNFRVIEYQQEGYTLYRIAEVYMDKSGRIRSWSTDGFNLSNHHESPRAVHWSLQKALIAFSKPMLREEEDRLVEIPGPIPILDDETDWLVGELIQDILDGMAKASYGVEEAATNLGDVAEMD